MKKNSYELATILLHEKLSPESNRKIEYWSLNSFLARGFWVGLFHLSPELSSEFFSHWINLISSYRIFYNFEEGWNDFEVWIDKNLEKTGNKIFDWIMIFMKSGKEGGVSSIDEYEFCEEFLSYLKKLVKSRPDIVLK